MLPAPEINLNENGRERICLHFCNFTGTITVPTLKVALGRKVRNVAMIATIIILTDALTLHYLITDTDFSTDGRFSRLDRELSTSRLPQKSV